MATILDQRPTGDGYDVRFETAGQAHTLHWPAQPTEKEIAEALLRFEEQIVARTGNNNEEGDYGLFDW